MHHGFGTERNGEEGFVLASHCTNEQRDVGGIDYATIHQPNNPWIGSNVIGRESIDPQPYEVDNYLCTDSHRCRYSDAAYVLLDSGEDLDLGMIAEPEDYNETDVDPSYETIGIAAEQAGFSVGQEIEFIGRTSGWEKAEITSTCAAVEVEVPLLGYPGTRILCSGEAEPLAGFDGPDPGDSGAPVFIRDGDEVKLIGTIFSGDSFNFHFSNIGFIYYELGPTATWDTCTSGC